MSLGLVLLSVALFVLVVIAIIRVRMHRNRNEFSGFPRYAEDVNTYYNPPDAPFTARKEEERPFLAEELDRYAEELMSAEENHPKTKMVFSRTLGRPIPCSVVCRCKNGSYIVDTERGPMRKRRLITA